MINSLLCLVVTISTLALAGSPPSCFAVLNSGGTLGSSDGFETSVAGQTLSKNISFLTWGDGMWLAVDSLTGPKVIFYTNLLPATPLAPWRQWVGTFTGNTSGLSAAYDAGNQTWVLLGEALILTTDDPLQSPREWRRLPYPPITASRPTSLTTNGRIWICGGPMLRGYSENGVDWQMEKLTSGAITFEAVWSAGGFWVRGESASSRSFLSLSADGRKWKTGDRWWASSAPISLATNGQAWVLAAQRNLVYTLNENADEKSLSLVKIALHSVTWNTVAWDAANQRWLVAGMRENRACVIGNYGGVPNNDWRLMYLDELAPVDSVTVMRCVPGSAHGPPPPVPPFKYLVVDYFDDSRCQTQNRQRVLISGQCYINSGDSYLYNITSVDPIVISRTVWVRTSCEGKPYAQNVFKPLECVVGIKVTPM